MALGSGFSEFLSRLRGDSSQDRSRLVAILALNRELAKANDRGALLDRILDEAVSLFRAERGFVIQGASESTPRVVAARNLDAERVKAADEKVSQTVVRECLGNGRSVFEEDAQVGEFSAAQSVEQMGLRSVLCVPLRVGDEILGGLYLDHRFHSGAFEAGDLPWLEAFADQCAIALHLHRLLESARAHERSARDSAVELASEVVDQADHLAELGATPSRSELENEYRDLVGESPALLRALHLVDRVGAGDFPVLIVGESGCGKELVARAVHENGGRSSGPFLGVNVAALSADLVESELFGHVRGAFTGADRDRRGLAREADGGVLFLDEVTEMPLDMQAKLLRFLEEHMVRPVGSDVMYPVDLRVVAATNRDPLQAVRDGRFREDLYYRLSVLRVNLPPLRDRLSDLPLLVGHFLEEAARARSGIARRASVALIEELGRRRWAGNVRELRNVILRLDALAESDEIGTRDLEPEVIEPTTDPASLQLAKVEKATIISALEVAKGNKAQAARLLGISRRSLYDRLGRFKLS